MNKLLENPDILAPYSLDNLLGEGTYGQVYKARNTSQNASSTAVALKILNLSSYLTQDIQRQIFRQFHEGIGLQKFSFSYSVESVPTSFPFH